MNGWNQCAIQPKMTPFDAVESGLCWCSWTRQHPRRLLKGKLDPTTPCWNCCFRSFISRRKFQLKRGSVAMSAQASRGKLRTSTRNSYSFQTHIKTLVLIESEGNGCVNEKGIVRGGSATPPLSLELLQDLRNFIYKLKPRRLRVH